MRVYLEGIGVLAPGLVGWEQTESVLAGRAPYAPGELPRLHPALLSADVRRRTTGHIRLAIEVAGEAVRRAGADGAALASVFASSDSDGVLTHRICEEAAKDRPEVSPTAFHNSVNNAPAGYWCMAVRSRQPSTSVNGYDASFAVGLIEAAAQALSERRPVLLVAHDTPLPEPLHSARPFSAPFAVALVLQPQPPAAGRAALDLVLAEDAEGATRLDDGALEALRCGNPAARALPLLTALARRTAARVVLPYIGSRTLEVGVQPL
jgi:hypothetical protein